MGPDQYLPLIASLPSPLSSPLWPLPPSFGCTTHPCRVLTRKSEVSLGGWSLRCIRSLEAFSYYLSLSCCLSVCFTYCLVLSVSTTSFLAYLSLTMPLIRLLGPWEFYSTPFAYTQRIPSESKTLDAACSDSSTNHD